MCPSAAYKIFLWTDVPAVAGVAPPLTPSTWLVTPFPSSLSPSTSYSDGPAGWLLPPLSSPLVHGSTCWLTLPPLPLWLRQKKGGGVKVQKGGGVDSWCVNTLAPIFSPLG